MREYNFNISLSVLNHLGRNLYRSLITILGEAISNSWDADADNVRIDLDKRNNRMIVIDDGDGMDGDDFQDKFLKIGFSKRNGGKYLTKKGRPFIGRKGIGKLALLSCAKKITILSKKNGILVGGCIDNEKLDDAIKDDLESQDYKLENYTKKYEKYLKNIKHGTAIIFDDIRINIKNTEEYEMNNGDISKYKGKMLCPECKKAELRFTHETKMKKAFLSKIPSASHKDNCSYIHEYVPNKVFEEYVQNLSAEQIDSRLESALNLLLNAKIDKKENGIVGNGKENPFIITISNSAEKKQKKYCVPRKSLNVWIDKKDVDAQINYLKNKIANYEREPQMPIGTPKLKL